jgi:hypothetical protein
MSFSQCFSLKKELDLVMGLIHSRFNELYSPTFFPFPKAVTPAGRSNRASRCTCRIFR